MAQNMRDSFLDLERHRQLLEENIEKLRKSLRHWQIWEAEYEGLKEEILGADPTPNRQQLVALAHECEGDLVNRKEVDEILGTETRDAAQVVNILDRRIDYVEQNIRTVQKQVQMAEDKLVSATIISTPEVRNDEGLPLTEIVEELDEEGNIISSRTTTPGSAKPQLLEVLKKAGVDVAHPPTTTESESKIRPAIKNAGGKPIYSRLDTPSESQQAMEPFKEDDKYTGAMKPRSEVTAYDPAKRVESIMQEANQSEAESLEPPVIPVDESPEDAALRKNMLQYGLHEVGAVVAELNLEDGSDWSDEDYEDADSDTDDEDEFGRSKGKVVDDDMRQRMMELEERLGVRMMENVGKKASDYDIVEEGIGRVTINSKPDSPAEEGPQKSPDQEKVKSLLPLPTTSVKKSAKKTVRFSEDIDVSPPPQQSSAAPTPVSKEPLPAPISDIVERTVRGESSAPEPKKKASRFKTGRATTINAMDSPLALPNASGAPLPLYPAKPPGPKPFSQPIQSSPAPEQPRIVPSGPEGRTLASTIVEHDVPLDNGQEPDELDSHLLHQEVATEYHKMRNRMIQRQGGFMKEEEGEIVPFTEEEGGPRRMSRFKAARLARS